MPEIAVVLTETASELNSKNNISEELTNSCMHCLRKKWIVYWSLPSSYLVIYYNDFLKLSWMLQKILKNQTFYYLHFTKGMPGTIIKRRNINTPLVIQQTCEKIGTLKTYPLNSCALKVLAQKDVL